MGTNRKPEKQLEKTPWMPFDLREFARKRAETSPRRMRALVDKAARLAAAEGAGLEQTKTTSSSATPTLMAPPIASAGCGRKCRHRISGIPSPAFCPTPHFFDKRRNWP